MQFSTSILLAALAALVSAQANPFDITSIYASGFTAGTPVTITWQPDSPGTVTLLLKQGPSANLKTVATIVANAPNSGSFIWIPPTSLVQGNDYALEIVDDTNPDSVNFTPEFTINSSSTVSTQGSTVSSAASTGTSGTPPGTSALTLASLSSVTSSQVLSSTGGTTTVTSAPTTGSPSTGSSTVSAANASTTIGTSVISGTAGSASKNSTVPLASKTISSPSSSTSSGASGIATFESNSEHLRVRVGGLMLALIAVIMIVAL